MMFVLSKLKGKSGAYQKMLSSLPESMFSDIKLKDLESNCIDYSPTASADDFEWLVIRNFVKRPYALEIMKSEKTSVDYNSLAANDITKVDFIAEINDAYIAFQKIRKSSFLKKKFIKLGDNFEYKREERLLQLNKFPDAIYDKQLDNLYFKNLFNISHIFPNITDVYRIATENEVKAFLENEIFHLGNNFSVQDVKIPNRKKIAVVTDKFQLMSESDKKNLFAYIGEYCPGIKMDGKSFNIRNENDLRNILYGLEEKFYTTNISKEKRVANSTVKIG